MAPSAAGADGSAHEAVGDDKQRVHPAGNFASNGHVSNHGSGFNSCFTFLYRKVMSYSNMWAHAQEQGLALLSSAYRDAAEVQAAEPYKWMIGALCSVLLACYGVRYLQGGGLLFYTIPLDIEFPRKFAPLNHPYCTDHDLAAGRFGSERSGIISFSVTALMAHFVKSHTCHDQK
eukprot:5089999-Pleurochrysis_carterae.AAC.2